MMEKVRVVEPEEINRRLTDSVRTHLSGRQPLSILDAGCGRMWTWDLEDIQYVLTGLDADENALKLRVEVVGDLDRAIVGDITTTDLPSEVYDIVHSAYVLEHVQGVRQALDRMWETLRPGGLLVLKSPDPNSVYAFLARHTPHWVHVQYKRRIRGKRLAGTPGHGPYPVIYEEILALPALLEWASERNLELVELLGENSHLNFFGRLASTVDHSLHFVSTLSRGRLTADYSNVALVLVKAGEPSAS